MAEQLLRDIEEIKSFSGVGKKYGVSDNTVKKRCKRLGIYDKKNKYVRKK